MITRFTWKPGSHVSGVSADTAGQVFEQLESEGRLNAQTVVDVSRPEDAPLHPAFEWRDQIAAEEWRKHQARNMINAIIVKPETPDAPMMRVFYQADKETSNYESINAIIKQPDKMENLLRQAECDMKTFKAKYHMLSKLSGVIDAMDAVIGA